MGWKPSINIYSKKGNLWAKVFSENLDPTMLVDKKYFTLRGQIIGTVDIKGSNNGVVVQQARQGSGGFISYKVIAKENDTYKVIYESGDLKHGNIRIVGDFIEENSDDPLPSDSNCCPTYIKYRHVSFSTGKPEFSDEFRENNYFLKFQDYYSKMLKEKQ